MAMDKPDKPQESESGELPPIVNAPASRIPTPVLLRQLQSVLDRMKRAETSADEAPVNQSDPKK